MARTAAKRPVHDSLLNVDLPQLLITRLWIARLGEGDVQGWWRTSGILGSDGAFVGPRVLPMTHPTARARIAFAVATHTCGERYPAPHARHLFHLDPEIEDRLDALLIAKLEDTSFWKGVISKLEAVNASSDPATILSDVGVITDEDSKHVARLRLGPDSRSVPIAPASSPDETVRRLAAGFLRSSKGELTVPYLAA